MYFGWFTLEPEPGELPRVAHEPRGPSQHAGGDATVVGAGAAHVSALDQRHLRAKLARPQSRRHSSWSTAHYYHLKHLLPLS
jgi:hypothetical protein